MKIAKLNIYYCIIFNFGSSPKCDLHDHKNCEFFRYYL